MINSLFTEVDQTQTKVPDWATPEKRTVMAAAIVALRPRISLEIGVWKGASLFPMAMAHRATGIGRTIAVDPWTPSASIQGQDSVHADWWGKIDHEEIYKSFLAMIKELKLECWIQVERMISDYFDPPDGIGVLSIDGNHGPQAIIDVERYAPKVQIGGLVFMDDLDWGPVRQAADKLETMGFKELYRVQNKPQGGQDDWGCFQRVKKCQRKNAS